MNDFLGLKTCGFTSDYSVVDADFYDPFENVKKDENGLYVVLEDGRKIRFPSLLKMRMKIENFDGLLETD